MKTGLKKYITALFSAILLTSCGMNQTVTSVKEGEEVPFVKKESVYKQDTTTIVLLDDPVINADDIVKVIKHGDHWHVFTKDGKEHITYTDPASLQRGQTLEMVSVVSLEQLRGMDVTAIQIHGDHWHVFTRDGMEFLTYENPSSLFSHLTVTEYTGHDGTHSHGNTLQASVVKVVKILEHGDHWHIYTNTGAEFIVYTDPRGAYPDAVYGIYEGTHTSSPSVNHTEGQLPPPVVDNVDLGPIVHVKTLKDILGRNVTRIVDHNDHFHIYEGNEEIAVIHENPRAYFPNAEYIKEETYNHLHVDSDELFSYDSITEKLDEEIIEVLNENIKAMDHYGHPSDGIPVFGTDDKSGDYFYWLHNGDHYHALSIKDLIKLEKAGKFGKYTAKDVVAFLKYKIRHNYKIIEKQDSEEDRYAKIEFLKKYYALAKGEYYALGNKFEIQLVMPFIEVPLANLKVEDGVVSIVKELPKFDRSALPQAEPEPKQNEEAPAPFDAEEDKRQRDEQYHQEELRQKKEAYQQMLAEKERIETEWSAKYDMDREEFALLFYEIMEANHVEDIDITKAVFREDKTFIYEGKEYRFEETAVEESFEESEETSDDVSGDEI